MDKRKILAEVNRLLSPAGIKIIKNTYSPYQEFFEPSSSYMKDDGYLDELISELASIAEMFFRDWDFNIKFMDSDYKKAIEDFWHLYINRPFQHNIGGSGFHNAFWIFLFCRVMEPSLIIESGVWKGQTSWLFKNVAPKAEIIGYDINLNNLEYKDNDVQFFENDWSSSNIKVVEKNKSLIFFDCHVNHAKRILEAHDKGFRHLLIDDNPPTHKLYAYGEPGFPTAQMLFDAKFIKSNKIEWYWQSQMKNYQYDIDEFEKAKEIIEIHRVFPDVGGLTRYGGFSFLTYVMLRDA